MAKLTKFLPVLALSMAFLAGPMAQAQAEDLTADTVVATVNGANITLGEMVALRESLPEQYKSLADDVLFKGILDQLIQQTNLAQSMGDTLSKRDMLTLENQKRGYLSGEALKAVVDGAVTDATLQAAYDAKYKDTEAKTEYRAAHILVESEEKAADLKKQIEGGADFAELAKANSSDTGSGAAGGELGWFGAGMMVKPFEDGVMALKVGEISAPIKSDFGWHIIKLEETRDVANPTLDDVRDELAGEIESAVVAKHLEELTAKATITRPGEGIDPAVLKDMTILDK